MITITGHPLQAAQPIIQDDGTMAYHFRNWCFQVNQAVGATSLLSVWGNISGTLSDQTDLQTALNGKANTSHTHAAGDVTSGTFDNARISQSSVTQHQAALSITESQISDLDHTDITAVHTDAANEFSGLTEKLVADDDDLLIIEDSAAAGVKKKVKASNFAGGGGGGATSTVTVKHVIQTITNTVAGEFDFDSIPAGYDRLIIDGMVRSDASATSDTLYTFLNTDTTVANYYRQSLYGSNNATLSAEGADPAVALICAATSGTNYYSPVRILLEDYDGSWYKTLQGWGALRRTSTDIAHGGGIVYSAITAAVTRIRVRTDNHATDQLLGTLTLYGERATTLGGGTPTPVDNAATPYTLALADAYTCQRFTASSPAVTIPTNAAVAYPIGTEIYIRQAGTGTLTLTTTSLTINGTVPSWAQHVEVKFRKVATDTWDAEYLPSGGGATWGSITGTLSSQTDLQTALDARLTQPQVMARLSIGF